MEVTNLVLVPHAGCATHAILRCSFESWYEPCAQLLYVLPYKDSDVYTSGAVTSFVVLNICRYNPGDPHGTYRLWYNSILGTPTPTYAGQALLYANSSDGIVWTKPDLGLFDIGRLSSQDLKGAPAGLKDIGSANNIVMAGGGVGVFKDTSAAGGFKAFG